MLSEQQLIPCLPWPAIPSSHDPFGTAASKLVIAVIRRAANTQGLSHLPRLNKSRTGCPAAIKERALCFDKDIAALFE